MKKVNYLNNKDILKEIHKSKTTYCSYTDDTYADFDIILPTIDKINVRTIAEAKRNKAKKLGGADYEARKLAGEKVKQAECAIDYRKITKEELIFRIKDDGITGRTITWGSVFNDCVGLNLNTHVNKVMYIICRYNEESSKWDIISQAEEQ